MREAEINLNLFRREWTLVSLSEVGKSDLEQLGDAKPILRIGETISGYTGCNRLIGGTYKLNGESILISNLASTKKMCAGTAQKVETELLAVLNNAKSYKMDGVKLILSTADNRIAEFIAFDKE